MPVIRMNYQGDSWYFGNSRRDYYIRYCRMFQICFYGAILSFNRQYATNWKYWSNARVFYWVVPHYTGATHSIGLYWIEITLVFNFRRGQAWDKHCQRYGK